jgi:hypothetical protein
MYLTEKNIIHYKPHPEDFKIRNPYLKKIRKVIDENPCSDPDQTASLLLSMRNDFVTEYSFTIPYYEVLKIISGYTPIVEIGAGSGYWARCLNEAGADVIAFDSAPPGEHAPWEWYKGNPWFDDSWYQIHEGDESSAALHPECALFMAWPMPMNPMAYNALSLYKRKGGKTLIYIGDPNPASSGDEHFYKLLYRHREIVNKNLYGWPGISEKLLIFSLV